MKKIDEKQMKKIRLGIIAVMLFLFAVVLVRTAWISDDAYITLRTVDNFINGYGLRWNVIERTQSYTSPLWLFVISIFYALTGEEYYTLISLSIVISLLTVAFLLFRLSFNIKSGVFAVTLLLFSKTFIDYSTSGLENGFAHLLFVVFYYYYYLYEGDESENNRLFVTAFLASLITLNRMDHLLFVFPILLYEVFLKEFKWKRVGIALAGFFPFIAWEFFSIVYYGFPFPNTAYAKLTSGVEWYRLFEQGLLYVLDIIKNDVVGASAIIMAFIIFITVWKTDKKQRLLFFGMLLYLFYIVKIGGDFMSGRFFSVMILLSVITIARLSWSGNKFVILSLVVLIIGLFLPHTPVLSGRAYLNHKIPSSGIADERGYYFAYTGLFNKRKGKKPVDPFHNRGRKEKNFVIKDGVGMSGFAFGPKYYILDRYALSDLLLARIPFQKSYEHKKFRPGHLGRIFPEGYVETLKTGKNHIRDRGLAKVYDALTLISRGNIFSLKRWKEIIKMNSGFYRSDIHNYSSKMVLYADEMSSDYRLSMVNIPRKKKSSEKFRCGMPSLRKDGFLVFGPYTTLQKGCYRVLYRSGITPTKEVDKTKEVIHFDVFSLGLHLVEKTVTTKDFVKTDIFQDFPLFFRLKKERGKIEFRAFYKPYQKVCLDTITLELVDDKVCDDKIVKKSYFSDNMFLYLRGKNSTLIRPQISFMPTDNFSLRFEGEKAKKQLPFRVVWTSPHHQKREMIVNAMPNESVTVDYPTGKKESGKWTVSVFSTGNTLLETRDFSVLHPQSVLDPLLEMTLITTDRKSAHSAFYSDEKVEIKCKWAHPVSGKRVILDWINPQGEVAFSNYHHANFKRNRFQTYPYMGYMPMMLGKWHINVRIITFAEKSEDLLLGETSFMVSEPKQPPTE